MLREGVLQDFLTLPPIGNYYFRKAVRDEVNKLCKKFFCLKSFIKGCFYSHAIERETVRESDSHGRENF